MSEFEFDFFVEQLASSDNVASNFFTANREKIEAYNSLPEKDFALSDGKTIKARCKAEASAKLETLKRNKKTGKSVELV